MRHGMYLHDQLVAFTGIFAALSASGPVQKGKLSDNDMRWTVIEQSVDCRTKNERNPEHEEYIPKSRYSAINHYLSDHEFIKDLHFDSPKVKHDPEHFEFIKKECPGINDRLAMHFAEIFTRDPVPTYEGEFIDEQIDDENMSFHFENVQSTNWNSMRFKPPPS
jgi:glutamate--cysteine ligase catalytic subunit